MGSVKHNTAWLSALCRQEHGAFVELLDSYQPLVAACGRRCGLREQEVEDVVSTTFLKAYQALPGYRGDAAVSTWLYRIAYHQSVNVLRESGRARHCPAERNSADPPGDPVRTLEAEERKEQLNRALSQLPTRWLKAIMLRYWNHLSIAQIANAMKVSDVVVRSYLFRARKHLRLMLES